MKDFLLSDAKIMIMALHLSHSTTNLWQIKVDMCIIFQPYHIPPILSLWEGEYGKLSIIMNRQTYSVNTQSV